MSEKRQLVVNTLATGVSQFVTMLASLAFMPLLVRAFGLEQYGVFMLATSVTAYTVLLDLGVGSALTKFVAEHHASEDDDALAGSVSSALLLYTIVGVVGAGAMVIVGFFTGSIFDVSASDAQLLRAILWVGAAFQLWFWPASIARHVLAGLQRYGVLAATAILSTALTIVATVVVIVGGHGPVMLVTLNGVVMIAVSLVNVAALRRFTSKRLFAYGPASRLYLKLIFSFSWAVFIVQLSDVLFYQQTDRILLGVMVGPKAVGLYEAAAKFSVLLTYVSGLTVTAVLPLASRMYAQGRYASVRSLFLRGTKYAAALVAPIAVVLIVLAAPLIRVWLGSTFDGQAIVAQVLVLPHVAVCLGLMGDAVITGKGRLSRRVPYILGQSVLNVVLSILLIPSLGTLGVAVGTAVSHLIDFPLHMRLLLREIGVPLRELLGSVVVPVYAPLVVAAGIGYALSRSPLGESLIGIALSGAAALGVYWVVVALTGLSRQERAELVSGVAAARSRLEPLLGRR